MVVMNFCRVEGGSVGMGAGVGSGLGRGGEIDDDVEGAGLNSERMGGQMEGVKV